MTLRSLISAASFVALMLPVLAFSETTSRPNVVLVLADDVGFTDIAPYGSEIKTPTLSALAEAGIRFTNYHTAASCAPTRAMLLTGVDSHVAGVPNIPEMIPADQRRHSHYQGVLGNNVVTVATLLQDAGYHTYMAGKWHLGMTPEKLPSSRGFERTVVMADSGADNWEQKPYLPIYEKANWFADGKEIQLPEDFYSSEFLVDKAISFIDSNIEDGKPFFTYIPFQAVHIPVQAPQEFIDRYMGVYDQGWTALRESRLERAAAMGIVAADVPMVDMATTEDWDALSEIEKRYNAKRMAVYGAMLEAMDFHLGRLIAHLKSIGQYENTVFIFASDNGAEASGRGYPDSPLNRWAMARQGYRVDYETLGLKGSFNNIGASFASAAASPLSHYKFYTGEGGMRVPLIIAGRGITPLQPISHAFTWVTDITPTILQITGVSPPAERYGGRRVEPIIGRNLLPLLGGDVDRVYSEDETIGFELAGNAALFQGDYKIVLNRGTAGDNRWYLFDIVSDPGETKDLSAAMPQRLQAMLAAYERYSQANGVLPVLPDYNPQQQVAINGLHKRFGTQILTLIATLIVVVLFIAIYRLQRR